MGAPRKVLVIEAEADVHLEDGGSSITAEISSEGTSPFVRVMDWNDSPAESPGIVEALEGKLVRVTVEVFD